MSRHCPYCGAVVEDHQSDDAPCTVCFAHVPGGACAGAAFGILITVVVALGALYAWWLIP